MNCAFEEKNLRQAVLIVNSFTRLLYPLNMNVPMGLLPLANMKVIDYSMYWLTSQILDEIIVCYTSNDKEIKSYCKEHNWNDSQRIEKRYSKNISSSTITFKYMPSCTSTGDILRELDTTGVLVGTSFLLVNAGAITNLDLTPMWREHETRLKESSYNVMTSLFTHMPYSNNMTRSRDLALVINGTNRILAYSDIKSKDTFSILTSSLLTGDTATVRFDVSPVGIHLCGREVAMHFSDNYDYKEMCEDYLTNEVNNIDFGYQYYGYFDKLAYSQFIVDLRTYRDVVTDVIRRWCYPTVPDNALAGRLTVPYTRGDIYIHASVSLDYTTVVGRRSLLQGKCVVGAETHVNDTVIGEGCVVGTRCRLRGCVIGDNVIIGDDCVLSDCVLMNDCYINDHCILDKCTLGERVKVFKNVSLISLRLHNHQRKMREEEEEDVCWDDENSLKKEGKGEGYVLRSVGQGEGKEKKKKWSRETIKGCQGYESDEDEDDHNPDRDAYNQLLEYVRKLEQSDPSSLNDIIMEINCYRMAINCTYSDIIRNLVTVLIDTVWSSSLTLTQWLQQSSTITQTIRIHQRLLQRFLIGENTPVSLLDFTVLYASLHPLFIPFFGLFLQKLWDEGVVSDQTVMMWVESVGEEGTYVNLLEDEAVMKIVKYLQESESESESENESESESENESESESENENESENESETDNESDSETGSESDNETSSESDSNSNSDSETDSSSSSSSLCVS